MKEKKSKSFILVIGQVSLVIMLAALVLMHLANAETLEIDSNIMKQMYTTDMLFDDNNIILVGWREVKIIHNKYFTTASIQIINQDNGDAREINIEDDQYDYDRGLAVCRANDGKLIIVCSAKAKGVPKGRPEHMLVMLRCDNMKVTQKLVLAHGIRNIRTVEMTKSDQKGVWVGIHYNGPMNINGTLTGSTEKHSVTLFYVEDKKDDFKFSTLSSDFTVKSMKMCNARSENVWLMLSISGEVTFEDKCISSKWSGVIALYNSDIKCIMAKEFPTSIILDVVSDGKFGCYILASFPSVIIDDTCIGWCKSAPSEFYITKVDEYGKFRGGRAIKAEMDSANIQLFNDSIYISATCYGNIALSYSQNHHIKNTDNVLIKCRYDNTFEPQELEYTPCCETIHIVGVDNRGKTYICITGNYIKGIKGVDDYRGLCTVILDVK